MTYLNYYKVVLTKVSFDYSLFKKELEKANQILTLEERIQLNNWILANEHNLIGEKEKLGISACSYLKTLPIETPLQGINS